MLRLSNLRLVLVLAAILGLVSLSITACTSTSTTPDSEQNTTQNEPASDTDSANPDIPLDPTALVGELSGSVSARKADTDFSAAEVGTGLFPNSQVQTGDDGRARIDFPDETIVRVGPDSLFTVEVTEEVEVGALKRLFLQFGQVWVVLMGGELEVDTPSGMATVRGSYLSVWHDPDSGEFYMTCLEGTCGFIFGDEEIIIGALETIRVAGFGEPPTVGVMSEEEVQAWLALNPEAYLILDEIYSSVSGWVWFDENGNGLQDEEESPLRGVEVSLLSAAGEPLAAIEVDEDGFYVFDELLMGEYQLAFSRPEGRIFTRAHQGADDSLDSDPDENGLVPTFTLVPGQHLTTIDAGYVLPGSGAICPLTGLPVEDEALLALRPIFLSISIFPESVRPVTGINAAPVVFETLIDEGQTRLQALFYCGYPTALPESDGGGSSASAGFDISGVRSGRVFYSELAQLFGAGLIYGGASPEVFDVIAPYTCSLANTANQSDIGAAGVDVDRLMGIAESCQSSLGNTDLSVWNFGHPPDEGMPVDKFLMHYNYLNQSRWIYDPAAGGYVHYRNLPSAPDEFVLATDRLTGQAVVRQNILILKVEHQVMNAAGTILEFDLTDERGFAVLLRNGAAYDVCWSAVNSDYPELLNRYRPFLIYDCASGDPVNLEYGSLWVNVVDYSVGFSWQGEYWRAYQPYLSYSP